MAKQSSSKDGRPLTGQPKQPFTLYQQSNTKNWLVRFSIKGQGQQRKSLGTDDYHQAYALASRYYHECLIRAEQGLAVKTKIVSGIADDWIAVGKLTNPEKTALTRYIVGFWGEDKPESITSRTIPKFQRWRETYWIDGPGRDIKYVEYERDGKLIRRPPTRKIPSESTRHSEEVVLRKFLKFCLNEGYINRIPDFEKTKVSINARPSFTEDEMTTLINHLISNVTRSNGDQKRHYDAHMLFTYVETMRGSGMRPTECQRLRWGDFKGINFLDPGERSPDEFGIQVYGKGKEGRTLVPWHNVAFFLNTLYLLQVARGLPMEKTSLVWRQADGDHVKTFNEQLVEALTECGLRTDYRGHRRTSYSFRHYYITRMLNEGADIHLIARNAGTSVKMIEEWYAHRAVEQHADKLRPASTAIDFSKGSNRDPQIEFTIKE
ncbi:tyrosine-type recombinase/integrase [Gluconacetobacter sp. 1b LMG 1731]|uniref:Tyrosine-type recombinase/integrase n=1 Tax=Gluconacetobacter dulcium TaxID=2729096 RepID=A0A7W4NU95_9PROT|nr:tyrosine-type recombinase/integrase [Gluconacetobacter dulcium]MBB2164008.1 tyrosine-type recombinase/integrase [Gluconacetobacter dulcium]MBB2192712.1 tyrosine-type recombinase/integrase [Gluconacetobacter dulcium]